MPTRAQVTGHSVFLKYQEGRWLVKATENVTVAPRCRQIEGGD